MSLRGGRRPRKQSFYVVVFVTAKDKKQAVKIADGLLKARLIACANIVDSIESRFWWEGKIDKSTEALLVIKTRMDLFKKLESKVKSLHSYQTPEIIALPIIAGSPDYLKWIDHSVK